MSLQNITLFLFLTFLSILHLPYTTSTIVAKPNGVIDIIIPNYVVYLSSPTLILFSANGCIRCSTVRKEYEKANKILQNEQDTHRLIHGNDTGRDTRFLAVNCSEKSQEAICHEYKIEGFPAIIGVNYPRYYEDYTGPRIGEYIYRFYKSQFIIPLLSELETVEKFEKFISTDLSQDYIKAVIRIPPQAYMDGIDYDPYRRLRVMIFDKVLVTAHDKRNFGAWGLFNTTTSLGLTPDNNGKYNLNYVSDDSFWLEIYRNFDQKKVIFEIRSSLDVNKMIPLWEKKLLPLFGQITPNNYNNYLTHELPMVWVFYNTKYDPNSGDDYINFDENNDQILFKKIQFKFAKKINQIIPILAERFNNELLFVSIDSNQYGKHASNFGIKKGQIEPGIVIEDRFVRKNYVFSTFSQQFLDQNLNDEKVLIQKMLQKFREDPYLFQKSLNSINEDDISAWLRKYSTAGLNAVLRSEPESKMDDNFIDINEIKIEKKTDKIDDKNNGKKIKTIVGSKYVSFVTDITHGTNTTPPRDLVVIFYTSWCAQTPRLRAIIEHLLDQGSDELGLKINYSNENFVQQNDENNDKNLQYNSNGVIFAQIDTSLNDIPNETILETPMMYLYQMNGDINNPIAFKGGLEVPSVYQFLITNSKNVQNHMDFILREKNDDKNDDKNDGKSENQINHNDDNNNDSFNDHNRQGYNQHSHDEL